MLFKYIFTSPAPFHLHREESSVIVQPWAGEQPLETRPFGSDDIDGVRAMRSARLIAAKGGGGF
jgi:hypothetical protein